MSESHCSATPIQPGGIGDRSTASVPQAVWYDDAIQALKAESPQPAKLAALRMLAKAPQSWDDVLLVALTSREEAIQVAALQTLGSQARLESRHIGSFERLRGLPVLLEAAHEAWQAAWAQLGDGPSSQVQASPSLEVTQLPADISARLASLRQENEVLRSNEATLRADFDKLRGSMLALQTSLELAVQQETQKVQELESLKASLAKEREAHAVALHARALETDSLFHASCRLDRARKRWMAGSIALSLICLGSLVVQLAGRSPALASEPQARVVKAAESAGYRLAVASLASEASRLELDGDLEAALGAWQCISRCAKDQGLASHAMTRVDDLTGRISRGERLGAHQQVSPPHLDSPRLTTTKSMPVPPVAVPRSARKLSEYTLDTPRRAPTSQVTNRAPKKQVFVGEKPAAKAFQAPDTTNPDPIPPSVRERF
ncbi:MAG: hypothetical protein VKP62_16265 [Candidatus Sericytochromatia bacterium]|nr:hypothetical protein [Candidatus Sericytochromatia bacterium]